MVLIVLSTYNGAAYLREFLHSLQQQSYCEWRLLIRDDGSQDATLDIVKDFFSDHLEQLCIIPSHHNVGVRESFNRLVEAALQMPECEYVMFADQDDVWKPDKIAQTLNLMRHLELRHTAVPLLVHTDLHVCDADLNSIDPSLWHYEKNDPNKCTLGYLLYQNTATGCSMMVNKSLLEQAFPVPEGAIMHDWWCSMVAAVFGASDFTAEATLYYRQHSSNTIGAKEHKPYDIFKKTANMLLWRNAPYLEHLEPNRKQAYAFLEYFDDVLTPHHKELLHFFCNMEQYSWFQKRRQSLRFQCLRQGWIQNISLLLRV